MAGSQRADFPEQTEKLVLSVAANQAAIGLQEARLLSEQKRVASELDQRVAQRTSRTRRSQRGAATPGWAAAASSCIRMDAQAGWDTGFRESSLA